MIAPDNIPTYLTAQDRWLLWRIEQRINRNTGEVTKTKPPISYHTGKHCDVTNPASWTSLANVTAALGKSRAWDGVGIVLGVIEQLDELLIGLDLDNCLDEGGALADWAMPFLVAMASYAEQSPGGVGIKSIARIRLADLPVALKLLDIAEGDKDQARTRPFGPRPPDGGHAPGAQLFLAKRYFAITGRYWVASPEDVTLLSVGQIAQLGVLFGPNEQRGNRASRGNGAAAEDDETEPDEASLRDKLGAAFVRSPPLRERWEGGTAGLSDTTRSGRDMSVLAMLVTAGFTKGETRAALRLFEHGKLAEEPPRYFERMWSHTKATPHVEPAVPPEWEANHPPVTANPDGQQRRTRRNDVLPAPADLDTVWNPWDDPPLPAWPNGILSQGAEDTLAKVSLRDGLDLGLLATTILAGGSAAASKASRFAPYQHDTWAVPPITWIMTIGESGTRKTRLDAIGFSAIREARADLWRDYKAQHREWEALPKKERGSEPDEPPELLVNDFTPEALQNVLAASGRGTALVTDELVIMLEFGRYKHSGGMAGRGFLLSCYEDVPYPVHRVTASRTAYLEHTGLSAFGGIQPRRLAAFRPDMESDGLLQRFVYIRVAAAKASRPEIDAGPGVVALHKAIKRLCFLDARIYTTTQDGSDIIRDTEVLAREYASITDYGEGWPGFCSKLHGTEARFALILHLLEDPTESVIPTERVQRAHRLIHRFILQHAADFYASVHGTGTTHRDIAGWLLTRGPADPNPEQLERILASDLTNGVRSCRPLGSKAIGEILDPFVTGGWLTPENDYPNNRAWFFSPDIRCRFADRERTERQRRGEIRAFIQRIEANRKEQSE